jgi:16S rRNA (guanine527-N7)-methyltransferase
MNEDFKNKMIDLAKKIDVDLEESDIEKFYKYMNLLLEWNEKINLTAITEMNDVILKHFIDSITVLKYIDGNEKIVDVGTGAGFPGIPIAILKPNTKVTLLDSLNKRVLFLQDVIKNIDLKNTGTIHSRAEDFGQSKANRETYDISISRAVANLSTLSEYLLPLVKVGGRVICMKGAKAEEEIENAKFAIKELGGKIISVDNLKLPDTDMERTIIIIEKIAKTPTKYPRKAGTPAKSPISKNV